MKAAELAEVRGRLSDFAEEMFIPLARRDQRRWGECYLRGLMLDGKRKSIEPMAERLGDGDEQCLQQFVNQSPWAWQPVRERLARRMVSELSPQAWIVDDTAFPKAGRYSVGVARQYCGALGKVANCQIGVSVNAATDAASCPLNWRLFVPVTWEDDAERRAKAHLPEDLHHEPKWRLALAMLDELSSWELAPPVIVADAGYGEITDFRRGLEKRELSYLVELKGGTSAYGAETTLEQPAYAGRGRPPRRRYRPQPSSLRALALGVGAEAARAVAWREGSRGTLRSHFFSVPVRPANVRLRRAAAEGDLPLRTLLVEWPARTDEPVKYWLSNLPAETPLPELVRLAKLRWRIEQDYRELKDALGLDHFEGRSFRGWHHHVTLVSVAHGFLTLERLNPKVHAPV